MDQETILFMKFLPAHARKVLGQNSLADITSQEQRQFNSVTVLLQISKTLETILGRYRKIF